VFSSDCHPRKENHTKITCRQIAQVECAARKISLREFFESNQEGEDQAADNGDPLSALNRDRTEESQVDEQRQNPVQDEMSGFVSQGNFIDSLEDAKFSQISQDNNENNEQCKENGKPLHKKERRPT